MTSEQRSTPIAILAGGSGHRMGGIDKCLIKIGHSTILARLIEILEPQSNHLILNANGDTQRFSDYNLPIISDSLSPPVGPLGGLLSIMRKLQAESSSTKYLMSVAGDCPFIPENLLTRLYVNVEAEGNTIVFCVSGGRKHYVTALWPLILADALDDYLNSGQRSVKGFIQQHPHKEEVFDNKPVDPFFNINSSDQEVEAQQLLEKIAHD